MRPSLIAALVAACLFTSGVEARSGGSHSGGSHSSGTHSTHSSGHSASHSSTAHHSSTSHAATNKSDHPKQPHASGEKALGGHHTNQATYRAPDSAYGSKHTKGNRIERSPAQRAAFVRTHPCPSTGKSHGACPGYVVDHVVALKRGGADNASNMQWQTTANAKAKDKVE
jgi:hypothetical protein